MLHLKYSLNACKTNSKNLVFFLWVCFGIYGDFLALFYKNWSFKVEQLWLPFDKCCHGLVYSAVAVSIGYLGCPQLTTECLVQVKFAPF